MEKKSTKRIAVAPKITEGAAKWYEENFPSLNAGVTIAIEALPVLYQAGLAEIRGTFSRGELCMILDVMNGHAGIMVLGQSMSVGYHIPANIEDSFKLYPGVYEEKWEIQDPTGFIARINSLSRFHLVTLELFAAAWWEHYYEDVSADDWCKPLLEAA
jgi:hypothetical protein